MQCRPTRTSLQETGSVVCLCQHKHARSLPQLLSYIYCDTTADIPGFLPRHIYSKCYTDGQKTLSCQLHGVFASSDFTKILQVIRVVPMWYRGPVNKSRKDLAV